MAVAKKKNEAAPAPTAAHIDPIPPAPIFGAAPSITGQNANSTATITPAPKVTRPSGMLVLHRAQFINTVEIPALNSNRTLWIDHMNGTYAGIDFLWDQSTGFIRLEKPSDPNWLTVLVPISNVAALFPAKG